MGSRNTVNEYAPGLLIDRENGSPFAVYRVTHADPPALVRNFNACTFAIAACALVPVVLREVRPYKRRGLAFDDIHITVICQIARESKTCHRVGQVLARVPDTRRHRGRRYTLVFALARVLAGARSFREIGDQAADLPQEVLARLGGTPRRRINAPSEKRTRTLIQDLDLDLDLDGNWTSLRAAGCGPGGHREAAQAADRDRREMTARHRRQAAGQAVRRDAPGGEGDHRTAPDSRGH
jgi:DDE_Tnp_1-associated